MNDDVIPLNEIGKIETVNVYNQAYVDKQQKEIAELEAQIEKMKLCQNCRFESYDDMEEPCRNCSRLLGNIKRKGTSDKWEIMND